MTTKNNRTFTLFNVAVAFGGFLCRSEDLFPLTRRTRHTRRTRRAGKGKRKVNAFLLESNWGSYRICSPHRNVRTRKLKKFNDASRERRLSSSCRDYAIFQLHAYTLRPAFRISPIKRLHRWRTDRRGVKLLRVVRRATTLKEVFDISHGVLEGWWKQEPIGSNELQRATKWLG